MPTQEIDEIIWQQAQDLLERHRSRGDEEVVSYYPPEMEAQRDRFAIAYTALDGATYYVGDHDLAFPLQSLSKAFIYAMALWDQGRAETLKRVGVEPSGDAFNSFVFDERHNRPFNPMVNAGALVATSLVGGSDREEKVQRVLERLRLCAANPDLQVDQGILEAELGEANDRNLGLSYLMRSLGMLSGDVEENAATYLSICSVGVTARDLATMAATLANGGVNPLSGERAVSRACARDVVTVMSTCGMYDAAGQWAYDVGFPAKSGVCGGIMFTIPQSFGGAVFSPGLDVHGNSVRGVNVCRDLSERFALHEYGDPNEERLGLSAYEWARIGRS